MLKGPKNAAAHWHITSDDEALATIAEFTGEDAVYVENADAGFFALTSLRVMTRAQFERKKNRYMGKKSLRIYTADAVIKRNT